MLNEQDTAPQKRLNVLVLGDSCYDMAFYVEKANRLNPENPDVPLYNLVDCKTTEGMGMNVVNALKKLNAFTVDSGLRYCGTKVRYYTSEGKYLYRVDYDKPKPYSTPGVPQWTTYDPRPQLAGADIIVVSDYNKGAISDEFLKEVVATGKPVFIDTKKTNLADFSAPNVVFKINELEYDRMDHEATFNSCNLVVTRGAYGSECLKLNEVGIFSSTYSQGFQVEAVDVCGAGDMYLAGLVYGLHICKGDIKQAMKLANAYAAISVQRVGSYIPTKQELAEFIEEYYK